MCKFRELSSLNVPALLCVWTLPVPWAPIWRHLVFIPLPQSNFTEKLSFWSACFNHYLLFIAIWKAVLQLWSTSATWLQTSKNVLSNRVVHWYAFLVTDLWSCRTVNNLLLSAKSLEAPCCIKEKSPRSLPPIPSWGQAMKDKPEAQLRQQKLQIVYGRVNLYWPGTHLYYTYGQALGTTGLCLCISKFCSFSRWIWWSFPAPRVGHLSQTGLNLLNVYYMAR